MTNIEQEQAAFEKWANSGGHDGSYDQWDVWQARAAIVVEQDLVCATCNGHGAVGRCDNSEPCPDCSEFAQVKQLPNDLIELLRQIKPNYGDVGTRDCDVTAQRTRIDAAIAVLAHPQPSTLPVVEQEPVAWLHDTEGRVDVIHSQVKQLWIKMGQPNGFYREKVPCRVEHYTIPLYDRPQPSADDARLDWLMSKVCCDDLGFNLPFSTSKDDHFRAFRAAIDAAMKAAK